MFTFLVVLILLDAVLLALVVLLQSGKGGGLAGMAAGAQTQQILGARQAPDFLEKATWTLGGSFIFLCLIASFFTGSPTDRESVLQEGAADAPVDLPTAPPQAPPLGPGPSPATGPATGAPATGNAPVGGGAQAPAPAE